MVSMKTNTDRQILTLGTYTVYIYIYIHTDKYNWEYNSPYHWQSDKQRRSNEVVSNLQVYCMVFHRERHGFERLYHLLSTRVDNQMLGSLESLESLMGFLIHYG